MDIQQEKLVSVIVRTVNRPLYLEECLKSIERQNYKHVEIVLINDGGPSIQSQIKNLNLTTPVNLIEIEKSDGRSNCGNIGLSNTKGDYICFLDDDDIFYPFHIETLVEALESGSYKVAYTDSVCARQAPNPITKGSYFTVGSSLLLSEDFTLEELKKENYLPILTVMFSSSCLSEGLEFDRSLEVLEDWDFWIRLRKKYDFLHIPEVTSEYRSREDGTNTTGRFEELWNWSRSYVREKHGSPEAGS